ncbi:hypothetical protein BAE44_0001513 [Dichanthelium oligosanthes]|uniref:Uncharacterized protein n=1 Tax=Dichanthelium oligosanthes TaxID=888268 RepID=A0A1E5WJD6_9POAL|nr:hypothetical protein BAE44_0001513 [Dichanthelium oligosanthes]
MENENSTKNPHILVEDNQQFYANEGRTGTQACATGESLRGMWRPIRNNVPLGSGVLLCKALLESSERSLEKESRSYILQRSGNGLLIQDRSTYGCLFRKNRDLMLYAFNNCVISVCDITFNQVADCLTANSACMEDVCLIMH